MEIIEFIAEYPIPSFLIMVAVAILIIFITREIRCWYWKIDDRIAFQKQQINLLSYILEHQDEEISILREINNKLSNANSTNIEEMNEAEVTEEDDPE